MNDVIGRDGSWYDADDLCLCGVPYWRKCQCTDVPPVSDADAPEEN